MALDWFTFFLPREICPRADEKTRTGHTGNGLRCTGARKLISFFLRALPLLFHSQYASFDRAVEKFATEEGKRWEPMQERENLLCS